MTGLLHVQGEVDLLRRVDTLLVTLVAGGVDPHTGATLVYGDEVTLLSLLDEVARSNAKRHRFTEALRLVPFSSSSPSVFYTIFQGHLSVSFPLAPVALTHLAPTFMTSPYLSRRVPYCTPRRASRTTLHSFWHSISPSIAYVFAPSSSHISCICACLECSTKHLAVIM